MSLVFGYKIILIILLSFAIPLSAYAQEPVNSSHLVNNALMINSTKPSLSIPAIVEWHVGIFAIVGSAITFIGILLTIRFVYIDKKHEDRLNKIRDDREKVLEQQEILVDENKFRRDNIRWFAEYISGFNIAIESITNYRKANSHNGTYIDVICMASLFIVGATATTGFFEDKFILLLVIVGTIVFCPITHFIIQLRRTNNKFRFNHS